MSKIHDGIFGVAGTLWEFLWSLNPGQRSRENPLRPCGHTEHIINQQEHGLMTYSEQWICRTHAGSSNMVSSSYGFL